MAVKSPKGPVHLAGRRNVFPSLLSFSDSQSQYCMKKKNKDKQNAFHQLYLSLESDLSSLKKPWGKQHSL